MKKLITSALPYVNNVPHLGNIIGSVLSADVYARYCRMRGYETLYVCGTDEYGTATEMKAIEENKTPQQVCDHYFEIHKRIYDWFNIQFDIFGRTSTPTHSDVVQSIFTNCDKNGFITVQRTDQFYDEKIQVFLADRYLTGECPHCHFPEAHGDQCDKCSKLLQPEDLINLKSSVSNTTPVKKSTNHLYLDLPKLEPKLLEWMNLASVRGKWSESAKAISSSWVRDGLKTRSITRDLKWGVKVPKPGFEDKVFYVWFDAPIGYVSITANVRSDWKDWWYNDKEVQHYEFMGKDNVPFHSIIFPSILIGTQEPWTMAYHISATEYLNYENDKFSKSRGVGVFGTDAIESGISVDLWRFYLLCVRPEQQDTNFQWNDFQARINNELSANLGNLIHRALVFTQNKMDGTVPAMAAGSLTPIDEAFLELSKKMTAEYEGYLENVNLKEGLATVMLYARAANKYFQDTVPWKTVKDDAVRTGTILGILIMTIRNLGILIQPYLPETSEKLFAELGFTDVSQKVSRWKDLHQPVQPGQKLGKLEPLFPQLEDERMTELKARYSGRKS